MSENTNSQTEDVLAWLLFMLMTFPHQQGHHPTVFEYEREKEEDNKGTAARSKHAETDTHRKAQSLTHLLNLCC